MKWVALFSHTGLEIYKLSNYLKIRPFKVYHHQYKDYVPYMNSIMYYLMPKKIDSLYYDYMFKDADLITLHGYMKIIPSDICEKYSIFNLHPAPIHIYPELKGKDPVDRIIANPDKYKGIGAVIHKVTGDLDSGEIILSVDVCLDSYLLPINNIESATRSISFLLWKLFFKQNLAGSI